MHRSQLQHSLAYAVMAEESEEEGWKGTFVFGYASDGTLYTGVVTGESSPDNGDPPLYPVKFDGVAEDFLW